MGYRLAYGSSSEIIVCKICLAKLDIEGKWGKCLKQVRGAL